MAIDLEHPTRPLDGLLRGDSVAGLADADLVARFAAGPGRSAEAAFAAIVARHGPLVWGVCRRARLDPADADDAFQATFLVLARRARSVRVGDSLGRWLYGVSRRVAAKAHARRARLRRRETGPAPLDRAAVPPADPARAEALAALDDAVARLPEPFRAAIILCDLGGRTHEQAAAELGCPIGTIKSRLARGRDRLRAHLARRGFRPDDVAAGLALARPGVPPALLGATGRLLAPALRPGAPLAADFPRLAPLARGVRLAPVAAPLQWLAATALGLGLIAAGGAWVGDPTPLAPPAAPPPAPASVPSADPGDPAATDIVVEARDAATAGPMPGVTVRLSARPTGQDESAVTDAAGLARFRVRDPARIDSFHLTTGADGGFVPLAAGAWFDTVDGKPKIRERFVFRVERAVAIGGRVVDPAGRPVAGATVVVQIKLAALAPGQYVDTEPVETDPDGRWSSPVAPARPEAIRVAAFHPLHRTEDSSYHVEEVKDLAEPANGTLVTTLPERGVDLDGTVVDPAGRPVPGAEVTLGGGYGYGNSIPPIRADAAGHFRFGVKPGTKANLVATHPGFGPAGMKVEVDTAPRQVALALPSAATLAGQVVDPAGRPVPRAQVTLTWQPGELNPTNYRAMPVGHQVRTDADGRFAWAEAPPGAVQAEIYAGGFMQREGLTLTTGAANRIDLARPTRIRGTVVDAASGKPIPDFRLTPGAIWHPGERLIWQRDDLFPVARAGPGTFEIASEMNLNAVALRVGSGDHHAETSPTIPMDGATHDVTLRLTRGEPIVGRVVRPDGTPAPGVIVHLDRPDDAHRIDDGAIGPHERSRMTHVAAGPDGSFRLPPQRDPFALVALGDAGVALLPVGGFRSGQDVMIQPWASVGGTCKLGEEPSEGFHLARDQADPARSAAAGYPTEEQVWAKVAPDGRFIIPRLSPGRHVLGRWVANNADRRRWFQALAVVNLKPGEVATLDISLTGRPAIGHLRLPPLPAGLAPMLRLATVEPVAPADPDRERGVQLYPDGRFRVENLVPGAYALRLSVHEPPPGDDCGWGRLLGRFDQPFNVPDGPAGAPVDLGTIEPVAAPAVPLRVGDVAPPLAATTLDGRPLDPADLRGKVVLVDFWATWCAPCVAELPTLKTIQAEFGADPRFRLLSLSLDEDAAALRRLVAAEGLAWPQAAVGPDSPAVAAYGATAIPATFLIGPDGRIIARDLRGDALKRAVAKALGRP